MCHCQRRATSVRPTLTLPSEARCGQNTAGMGTRNPPRPASSAIAPRQCRAILSSASCLIFSAPRRVVSSVATRDRQPCGLAKADVSRTSSKVYMWHACACTVQLKFVRCSVAMSPPRKFERPNLISDVFRSSTTAGYRTVHRAADVDGPGACAHMHGRSDLRKGMPPVSTVSKIKRSTDLVPLWPLCPV